MTLRHLLFSFLLSFGISVCLGQTSSIEKSARSLIVDDYPFTEAELKDGYQPLKTNDCISYDNAWFYNDSLEQVILVNLYTDFHKMGIYHFSTQDIPPALLSQLPLHQPNGEWASEQTKQDNLPQMIQQGQALPASFFTSNNGFRIGTHQMEAIHQYGSPHQQSKLGEFELLVWTYQGDFMAPYTEVHTYPMAQNSFGHQVHMFFKEELLVGMILINDAP
ncbi:MAG: hypothetical protein AAF587_31140 [Bacteroidota bacterium]